MAKGPTQARQSRVNIVISDKLRGKAEPELPFRILVMGDYTQRTDSRSIESRNPVDINKSNFDAVMQSFNLSLGISVPNRITEEGGKLPVSLRNGTLKDFRPESIARQVPQLRNLLELREAMRALKPAVRDKAAQQKMINAIKDPAIRDQILKMVSMQEGGQAASPAAEATPPEQPSV